MPPETKSGLPNALWGVRRNRLAWIRILSKAYSETGTAEYDNEA